jgi:DNA-binding SARP family transcriptional activator
VLPSTKVHVDLLGRFGVSVGQLRSSPDDWPVRRAAELVALLALAEGFRLARDQVVDALWPHLSAGAGAANLRKAAHHARQALGSPDAVVLRGGRVSLFPSHLLSTDVGAFEAAAEAALRSGSPEACTAVARGCGGELLPTARYEEWTQQRREHLRARYADLLRTGTQWERLLQVEPVDEPAHCALMREELDAGNRHAALRWFGRLSTVLAQEIGVKPGVEAQALYEECVEGLRPAALTLVGRQVELAQAEGALRGAASGAVTMLVVRGPGESASLLCARLSRRLRRSRGGPSSRCKRQPVIPPRPLPPSTGSRRGRWRCQCPHWGYLLSGRLQMTTPGGTQVFEAGRAVYWAPGHVPIRSRTRSTSTSRRPRSSSPWSTTSEGKAADPADGPAVPVLLHRHGCPRSAFRRGAERGGTAALLGECRGE